MSITKASGIYKITNLITNKVYVGSAINLYVRKNIHYSRLRNNKHENSYLQNAWNKDGVESFKFEVIELCDSSKLLEWEQFYIDAYNACDRDCGYNIIPIAGNQLGVKRSEKTRKLISQVQLNKIVSKETKDLLLFYASKPKSEKTKAKISKSLKNKEPYSLERRINMSNGKMNKKLGPLVLTKPPVMLKDYVVKHEV